jgi:hypothetical protein
LAHTYSYSFARKGGVKSGRMVGGLGGRSSFCVKVSYLTVDNRYRPYWSICQDFSGELFYEQQR